MEALTPAERRGALLVALLLALGAAHDLWRGWHPRLGGGPVAARVDSAAMGSGLSPPGAPGERALEPAARPFTPGAPDRGAWVPTIDLNRASARELDALPGVGPVLAARIVAHREQQGPFRHREELLAVRGIGPRLYARIAPYVAIGEVQGGVAPADRSGR